MKPLQKRIENLLVALNKDLYEREDIMAVSLLSALSEQNIFLYGPPGTAKSLISRRLSKAFKTEHYFEYLMQKFSTPEEVFGPVSIIELKKDNYIRKTEGYLPEAEFAFLDEIWKSSPAILNTLLTLINEKVYKNGSQVNNVPLKVLISASNETPPSGQGLEALYDRFLTRLYVPPMDDKQNFNTLLQANATSSDIDIDENLLITTNEWKEWKEKIVKVKLSDETLNIIHSIRVKFEEKKLDIYVSDRRWAKAALLLKAGAFFCDRQSTNIVDNLLLSHCLWTSKDNREDVIKIVEEAVEESGFETGVSFKKLDEEKDELDKEINKEMYHKTDVYETVKLDGNTQYFKVTKEYEEDYDTSKVTFYIPYSNMKTKNKFNPLDKNGNELKWIRCEFDTQGTCQLEFNTYGKDNSLYLNDEYYWKTINNPFKPTVIYHKGDKKSNVNERLIESLELAVLNLSEKIEKSIKDIEAKKDNFLKELETPFVPKEKIKIAIKSVEQQIESMNLRLKDCERLEALVK